MQINPRPVSRRRLLAGCAVTLGACGAVLAAPDHYWPMEEAAGTNVPDAVGGMNGTISNGVSWVSDATRGQVLEFDGVDGFVDAGSIPVLGVDTSYTWSFWSNTSQGANNNVIVGNRYGPGNVDFAPREFTKFTNNQFEWHVNGGGQNNDGPDQPMGTWVHNVTVKDGSRITTFQNGLIVGSRTVTLGMNNAQPLYFGGNEINENWGGRLDDVAVWSAALPAPSVYGLAQGVFSPADAPGSVAPAPKSTVFSSDFGGGLGGWTALDKGLENTGDVGYDAPSTTGGVLTLGGTTTMQYWYGTSVLSDQSFDASVESSVSVDRVSLSGTGTAYRSSLWIYGDDTHYLHFSQNAGENGWQWNANDEGGIGTRGPTGGGNNIVELDAMDGDLGLHNLRVDLSPTGVAGEVNMFMFFDDELVAAHGFSNFPDTFQVMLTGQGRAAGDTVTAVFDNVVVSQVPEPAVPVLTLTALAGLALRRRRRARNP